MALRDDLTEEQREAGKILRREARRVGQGKRYRSERPDVQRAAAISSKFWNGR